MLENQHFKQFTDTLKRSEAVVARMFPIQGPTKTLEVSNLRWTNVGPEVLFDVDRQKQAKLKEQSLNAVLVGDVVLREVGGTGKVLDRALKYPLLSIPHLTMNAGYIVDGKERQVINQFRLRPGVYTRFTGDDNVEAFLNTTAVGTYKIVLDRATGILRMRVGSTARTPIYSVLVAVGMRDDEIRTLLGSALYAENKRAARPDRDIPNLLKRMRPYLIQPTELGEKSVLVRQYFESKPLDPAVNKVTLGKELDKIDRQALEATIRKIIKLSNGTVEPDDTESLAFKYILSIEDFVPERLEKAVDGMKYKIQGDLRRRDEIRLILPPNRLSSPVESFFTGSEFTRYSDQHNPIDMAAVSSLTTSLGDGGISSPHAVTDEIRTIHPSHYGLLDPMHTPEGCCSADMEVMTDRGWVAWPEVTQDTRFACLDADQGLSYHHASELHVYDHDGPLYGFKSETLEYLLTPNHRQWVRPIEARSTRGYRFETAEEMHGKRRRVRIGGHLAYEGQAISTWQLPEIPKGSNAQKAFPAFAIEDWAEFLGWYLSEGSSRKYVTSITQYESANPKNVARIEALLTRMQVTWSRSSRNFAIPGKQLVSYLQQFGHSDVKYIPEEVFDFPAAAREVLLEALMLGDGRKGKGRCSCYCTTSEQLAEDVQRLAFGLGMSSRVTFEPDTREEHYRGCWIVHLHAFSERQVLPQMRAAGNGQFVEEYRGRVYCATVPGGLLYIRRAGKSGFWSGNSKVGVTSHLTIGAIKKGQTLYVPVYDAKTGKRIEVSVQDLDQATIAFPDQYDNLPDAPVVSVGARPHATKPMVKARSKNVFKEVRPTAVDYIFVSSDSFFSSTTAAIPFLPNNDANRVLMGDKHVEQSVNLLHPDAPLVQHRIRGRGYEEMFGERLVPRALDPATGKPVGGEIMEVTKTSITIKPTGGGRARIRVPLHDHYPLNSRTFLHDTAIVKKGDRVEPGQALATNNFTKDGQLAIGKNLRVAYTAYKGFNFEDGVVISEGAAKKLTSVHKYEARVERKPKVRIGADAFVAAYPSELEHIRERGKRYDAAGIIKKGQVVVPGDILIPAIQEVDIHPEYDYKQLHRSAGLRFMNVSESWDHDFDGVVIDVIQTRAFVKVILKSEEPMQIGDKLSTRHGSKGIVVKILPDAEMYRDESGAVVDVLLNPAGVPGRVNVGQMLEAAAGKLALKTGKTYYADNFNASGSAVARVRKDLADAGISDEETLTDPKTGHQLGRVLVGDTHIYKLTHQVAGKMKSRAAVGEPYSVDEQPTKGSGSGSQRIGILDTFSLLSGDATAFLHDAFGLKSQKNDEYWRALQLGQPLPPPRTPFVEEKFIAMLLGAGIDLKQKGSRIEASPLTDTEVRAMSNGVIERPTAVKASNLKPERGGLFDPGKTGGPGGNYWNHIELASAVVHPLMLAAAASVGGFKTRKEMDQVIAGLLAIDEDGVVVAPGTTGAVAGGAGVQRRLAKVDVKRAITETEAVAAGSRGAKLDQAYKRLRYLRALDRTGMTPTEAYVNKTIPIIPAKFRQISPMPDGSLSVADANHGYREVLLINEKIKQLQALGVDEANLRDLNKALADATAGLIGTAPPLSRGKVFRGLVSQLHGPNPKSGFAQSKLMRRNQDLSGRSTVIPNPKLGMDEVGIPAGIAFNVYKPFLIKRLVEGGHKPLDARSMVEAQHPAALRALHAEIETRPVLMNRAPSLHKFSIQALRPRIIDGKAIEVNPLIVSGYNMDFDGDQQLSTVLGWISNEDYSKLTPRLGAEWFRVRRIGDQSMAARFGVTVPSGQLGNFYCINLEDFLHEALPAGASRRGNAFFFDVPEGVHVVALDEATGRPTLAPVKYWSVHTGCEVVTVELRSKRQILTDDDPRAVYGIDPETLAYVRHRPVDAVGVFVPRVRAVTYDAIVHESAGMRLTEKSGYFIGATAGDGWASRPGGSKVVRQVHLTSIHDEIVDGWRLGAEEIVGKELHVGMHTSTESYGRSRRASISNTKLAQRIEPLVGKGAQNKHLPSFACFAPREFKLGLLAGLLDTDGAVSVSNAKARPQYMVSYASTSLRLVQEIQHLLISLGIRSRITASNTPAKQAMWALSLSTVDLHGTAIPLRHPKKLMTYAQFSTAPRPQAHRSVQNLVPMPAALARAARKHIGSSESSLYVILTRAMQRQEIARDTAVRVLGLTEELEHPLLRRWAELVQDDSVTYDRVTGFTPTGRTELGYDLAVPGFETFMAVDGLILSNTAGIHVPVSEEARHEALEKLLPSRNLFSPRAEFVVHAPTKETVLGIYLMTMPKGIAEQTFASDQALMTAYRAKEVQINTAVKVAGQITCAGQVLLNSVLPPTIQVGRIPVTSKVLDRLLVRIAKESGPDQASALISKLKDLGNHYVTDVGFSVSLRDLEIDTGKRDTIIKRLKADTPSKGFDAAAGDALTDIAALLAESEDNRFVEAGITSGALGSKGIHRMLASTVAVTDHRGRTVPIAVEKSYAEGHDLGTYLGTTPGARKGLVDKGLSVADTGYFSRMLVNTTIENQVSAADCGTKSGVDLPLESAELSSRYGAEGPYRNVLITADIARRLRASGARTIKVRSPLTCQAQKGVCQMCFGLLENGKKPTLGYHVGALAGQTLGEVATQLTLRSFHTGGAIGGPELGFERIRQIMEMPQSIKGKAVLSHTTGVVTRIDKAPAGGQQVYVGLDKHFVPRELGMKLQVGDRVNAGDMLSATGVIKPQELLETTGDIQRVRQHLINELDTNYRAAGKAVNRRIFETVVKPLTDRCTVTDVGDGGRLFPVHAGDMTSTNAVEEWNRRLKQLNLRPIQYDPMIMGIKQAPLQSEDFVGTLSHEKLKKTLSDAPSLGKSTDLLRGHPMARLALTNLRSIDAIKRPRG